MVLTLTRMDMVRQPQHQAVTETLDTVDPLTLVVAVDLLADPLVAVSGKPQVTVADMAVVSHRFTFYLFASPLNNADRNRLIFLHLRYGVGDFLYICFPFFHL